MKAHDWTWLRRPLGRSMRNRLEISLGVVVTGAAIVGLSTVIRPDPSKTAPLPAATSSFERQSDADLRPEPPVAPRIVPELAKAVANGDLDTMERLYTPGMPLEGLLPIAAESGERAAAVWLLDHGAHVREDEGSVDAPVLLADEHPDVVALLLERGAQEPALATAAQAGAATAVLRLLSAHAAMTATDPSPLYAAVTSTRGSAENKQLIIDKLLAAGADPNRDVGDSPLTAAVRACEVSPDGDAGSDCLPLVKQLVKHGARTRGDTLIGALSLEEPVRSRALDVLLATRLEPGATAVALSQAWNPEPTVLARILAKGVAWGWHDGENDAALPLLTAVQRADRDFVRLLLDAGAPANAHFKDGTCPLGVAIDGTAAGNDSGDNARVVELLIARGADVNRRLPDGRTPLFAAAESGELRVVNALLERGARVNDLVLDDTALDAAERNGHQPAARILHAHGARRARRTSGAFGDTP